jgi:outer membrane biosynthesis protein TonB
LWKLSQSPKKRRPPRETFGSAMIVPARIYHGFRYLDLQVMQALSTAPAMRVRIGGNVQRAKPMNKVDPVYSDQARANGIQGTVRLHVIIAINGSTAKLLWSAATRP